MYNGYDGVKINQIYGIESKIQNPGKEDIKSGSEIFPEKEILLPKQKDKKKFSEKIGSNNSEEYGNDARRDAIYSKNH